MKLANPFSDETRLLYLYRYDCDICGSNQMLELNHIIGRKSASPLNASVLCHECHSHVGHTEKEEQFLFTKNLRFLKSIYYNINKDDMEFLRNNPRLITNNEHMQQWLQSN